jgi:hypothetical protein
VPVVNCYRDYNGSFTLFGALADCIHFVREYYETLTYGQFSELGMFIAECMAPSAAELDNAAVQRRPRG